MYTLKNVWKKTKIREKNEKISNAVLSDFSVFSWIFFFVFFTLFLKKKAILLFFAIFFCFWTMASIIFKLRLFSQSHSVWALQSLKICHFFTWWNIWHKKTRWRREGLFEHFLRNIALAYPRVTLIMVFFD